MSPRDSALANLQQTIDDLERQGQRAERDETLARETATTEVLQIINSGNPMRRRELFGVVAGAVTLLPVASLAQHLERVSHVGVLMGFSENRPADREGR